jgi:hypothetical protein
VLLLLTLRTIRSTSQRSDTNGQRHVAHECVLHMHWVTCTCARCNAAAKTIKRESTTRKRGVCRHKCGSALIAQDRATTTTTTSGKTGTGEPTLVVKPVASCENPQPNCLCVCSKTSLLTLSCSVTAAATGAAALLLLLLLLLLLPLLPAATTVDTITAAS